jgi:uncharacterized protein YjdB
MTTNRWNGPRAVALSLVALLGASCGPDALGPEVPRPTDVTISPSPLTIGSLGQQVQLTAMVLDQNGEEMPDLAVTWTSGNPAILVHEGAGRFRSLANGPATVTARTPGDEGVEGTVQVTVAQAAAGITLTRTEATLWAVGQTEQWTARAFDALGTELAQTPAFTWTSANATVASVSVSGMVTAVSDGSTQIRAAVGAVNNSLPVDVSATVPYELCVNLSLGSGPGTEVCTTLAITVHQ